GFPTRRVPSKGFEIILPSHPPFPDLAWRKLFLKISFFDIPSVDTFRCNSLHSFLFVARRGVWARARNGFHKLFILHQLRGQIRCAEESRTIHQMKGIR
ncbi:MAG: hypothetical protein L0Y72_25130, partial [Gemmataceae bacterium]|nr:hypothetical protein [Gemmataceae bacterium]MCI0742328.1 hypothetical protein [Gemmataceae bacterium]